MKTTRAVLVAVAVLAGFGAMAADVAGAISAEGLVAWWPFGKYGLSDASWHGYSLVAGPATVIGETVTLAGTSAGNKQSGLSVSGIPFSQMEAVTVECWIRYSTMPEWAQQLIELSPDFNTDDGAFVCYNAPTEGCIYSGVRLPLAKYSMVKSSSDVLAEKIGEWRHVAVIYSKGTYGNNGNNLRIYVDGVDVTKSTSYKYDTTGANFPDKTLYFGGHNGTAVFSGEMDSMKVWSRALTADEVAFNYAAGRDYDPNTFSTVTGSPFCLPCKQMSPSYGRVDFTNGEHVVFSAKCDLDGVSISGWRIYTNATDSIEKVLMLSGTGTSGSFIYPGVVCNLEWQFSSIVCFASPVELKDGEASFSCFASNGSAGNVRVLAVYGSSPEKMDATNELGSVTVVSSYFNNVKISNLPSVGVLCVRLIAVGSAGEVVALSPIKVVQWAEVRKLCYYPFGEAGYQDASGHGLDLSATGPCALESGAVTLTPGDTKPTLHTTQDLDLSALNSYVASCWFRADALSKTLILMEQMVSGFSYLNKTGSFIVYWDNVNKVYQASLKPNGGYSVVESDQREMDAEWHNVAVVFAKKMNYPDDIKVYVDGVNCSREDSDPNLRKPFNENFAVNQLWLGGRGDADAFSGQMDEVMVAECSEGAEDVLVAQIHGEGLLAVKGELSSDSVTVEVPDGCPADQVFPPVGTTFGYGSGETVPVVAEGKAFDRWLCTLSTNGNNSAEWKTWRRLPATSGEFQHPGVPVKVSWRKKTGLVLMVW